MEKQNLILKKQDSFELEHIFDCGQCFRWNKNQDNSYTGVIKNGVLNVAKNDENIYVEGICDKEINQVVNEYFDLDTNYAEIKNKLSNIDEYMKESTEFGSGIRILKQDLWECIISFIISANNNIPRIKKIIERISMEYGKEIVYNEKKYYTFPTPSELSKASINDLRKLGLGFRDKRVYNTTKMIINKEVNLEKLIKLDDTNLIREELLKLDGVGPKVADCIMLFSMKRYDSFPIDVWVRRVMNQLYIHNEFEEKVNKKELEILAKSKFGNIAGLAQQYLFYWKRENN